MSPRRGRQAGALANSTEARLRIGCSGWAYDAWKGVVYPAGTPTGRWLERYSQTFDTVEVNSTFYRLPRRDAVARWVEQTPADFVFAVKASRYLTHVKRLRDLQPDRLYERIEPLVAARKLGPVLWQLPANFHRDDERLEQALGRLPAGRHAFEFRHSSWFTGDVFALLREHGVALVLADHRDHEAWPAEPTTDWRYVRMHYGSRGRRGNYSMRELEEWARRVREWRRDGDVYCYFNNDWEAFAPDNASRLKRLAQR